MPLFELWCAPCLAKEHRKGSPDVKCWGACEHCGTFADLYTTLRLDPLDYRIHTAIIDASAETVLLIKRNGRKTHLRGMSHCERWLARAYSECDATKVSGQSITFSFTGEIFEDEQDKFGKDANDV